MPRRKSNTPPELIVARRVMKQGTKDIARRVEALIARYVKAEADVAGEALIALNAGKLGERRYRLARSNQVRAILSQLERASAPETRGIVRESYRLGARVAEKGGATGRGFSRVDEEAIDTLLENLDTELGDARAVVGRNVNDIFRKEGLRLATKQLADERGIDEATRELVERLEKQGMTAFVDRIGKRWALEHYARMAIVTTKQEAVNTGTSARMIARGFDLAEVNSVPNPCDEYCAKWDGKTVSLTGRSKQYPHLTKLAPFHPFCQHFITMSPLAVAERASREQAA